MAKIVEALSGHYVRSCRDRYTGQKSELKEIVKENIKLKKLNGEENYSEVFLLAL